LSRARIATVFVIAVASILTSCSIPGGDMPELTFDETVNDAVLQVARDGTTLPVGDVIDVPWDEVALFTEGAEIEAIETTVGETGLKGKRYLSSSNLMVFRKEGEVVALVGTSADVFTGKYDDLLGPDSVLTPDGRRGAGYVVLTSSTE
jgi:hypothetical protein